MADSKHTKKSKSQFWPTLVHCLVIIVLIPICCGVFYYLWFISFLGSPVTTQQVVFEFSDTDNTIDIENSDSTLNIIDKKDFEEIQKLAQDIINTNKDISQKIKNSEYLSVSNLNGFYAALFTFMAVIAGIFGFVGWKNIRDLRTKLDKFSEIERDVEFLKEKGDYVQWIEERFRDISNQNLEKLVFTKDDKNEFSKIKNYVVKNNDGECWLALIYAYQLIFSEDKNLEVAKSIMASIDIKLSCSIDPNKPYLRAQFYHIFGQLYFQNYLLISNEYNLFNSTNVDLKEDNGEKIKCVEIYLENSYKKYKILLDDERLSDNINRKETLGNIALNRIELYKIRKANKKPEKKLLNEAMKYLDEIGKIKFTFNQLWDYYRVLYYLDNEQYRFFEKDIKRKPKKKEEFQSFIQSIIKEQSEFKGEGFPGSDEIVKNLEDKI